MIGQAVIKIIEVPSQFDVSEPFAQQAASLIENLNINSEAWQGESGLVVLPSLNFIAALVLAELHGRMGHFPTIIRIRPVPGSTPTVYEIAEIINLQSVRDSARMQR